MRDMIQRLCMIFHFLHLDRSLQICAKTVEVLLLLADAGDLHKFESIDFKYQY